MSEAITSFTGEYEFLSNFYPSPIKWDGEWYPTAEHAYQAGKTLDPAERQKIRFVSRPGKAKRLGNASTMRVGWDAMRDEHMEIVLTEKFEIPELRAKLLATKDRELIEGNNWHDMWWGQCYCEQHRYQQGRNMLGELLMAIRDRIRVA